MAQKYSKTHAPFRIRKCIFFAGLVLGAVSGSLLENYPLGLCIYFGVVTFSDLLATYVFALRASDFSDPKQLRKVEKISIRDLDRYYDSRRNIRALSLSVAALSQIFYLSPMLFCWTYISVTLTAAFYTKFVLNIGGPVSLHFVELSRQERHQMHEDMRKDSDDVSLGLATGFGPYGFLKSRD